MTLGILTCTRPSILKIEFEINLLRMMALLKMLSTTIDGLFPCRTVVCTCVFVYSAGTGAICAWNWHDVLAKVIYIG